MNFVFSILFVSAFLLSTTSAWSAKRVALVIGQGDYSTGGLTKLPNPTNDARRMAGILKANGFDVISCDRKRPGCYDLTRAGLLKALTKLELAAEDAEPALVFYAGHGLETDAGNILAPVDATVDCKTWAVKRGVLLEQFVLAASPAEQKVIIIDACRDNPMAQVCPPPDETLSFADIKVPNARDFLLVTSTKPGQPAQDGPPGTHSPFANELFDILKDHPGVFLDQVFNRVAKAVVEATQKTQFVQLPETIVRGGAPEACLRGRNCGADPDGARMSKALADLKKDLRKEFAGMRGESDAALVDRAMKNRTFTKIGQAEALARLVRAGAEFQGVDWSGSSFAAADITQGVFKGARLHGVDLANVTAKSVDFEATGLRFAILKGADFRNANLSRTYGPYISGDGVNLSGANLTRSNLTGSDFRGADFTNANLENAALAFADLRGAKFDGANLSGAYLAGAKLDDATFAGATIRATDFGGATATKFALTKRQRRGACRSAVYRRDGDVDFTLGLFERRKDPKAKDGHAYRRLYRERIQVDLFGDTSLPLCPDNPQKPKSYNAEFPGSFGIYVDADWSRANTAARRVLAMVHALEKRIVAASAGPVLKGDGGEKQAWLSQMERSVRRPTKTEPPHLGADHFLPVLLKYKAIDTAKIKWKRRAEIRHWLERRVDKKLGGRMELESQWPRFFPKGVPFSQLPSQTARLFQQWTMKRAALTSDKVILRPAFVEFRKLLRNNSANTLTFPIFGYLYSAGGPLRATPTDDTAPSWFKTKDIRGRWLGLEAYERSMGLDKVMLIFDQPMKDYKAHVPRKVFAGVDPRHVVPELDLVITKIDASRKSRYGPVAIIFVRPTQVRLRTSERTIWHGKPTLPTLPPESITDFDVLGVKLSQTLRQAERAARKALGSGAVRSTLTKQEALGFGIDHYVIENRRPTKRLVLFTRPSEPNDRSLLAIAWMQRYKGGKAIIAQIVNSLTDKYGKPHGRYRYNSGATWLVWGGERKARMALKKEGTSAECALYPLRNFFFNSRSEASINAYELKAGCGRVLSVFVSDSELQMLLMNTDRVRKEFLDLKKQKAEAAARAKTKRAPKGIKF